MTPQQEAVWYGAYAVIPWIAVAPVVLRDGVRLTLQISAISSGPSEVQLLEGCQSDSAVQNLSKVMLDHKDALQQLEVDHGNREEIHGWFRP